MKKLFTLILIIFAFQSIFGQTFTEKKIAEFPGTRTPDIYSFKSDPKTGAYVYGQYDTATSKYTIYTNKGKTGPYSYYVTWQTIFDKDGNSYSIAYNNITDTTYTYFLLKNAEVAANFDYINEGWIENNGTIYFACKEKDKNCIASYNMSNGKLEKGKPYDEIIPCFMKTPGGYEGEGEPIGELAFTKDGKIFYLAVTGNEKFLVIGDVEQKHYSDIDLYSFTQDKNGVFTYIACDKGKFYDEGANAFIVQGDKEYKKYAYINGPVIFDANNIPVYTASDSGSYSNSQRLVIGDKEGKVYDGGIYDVKFTPSGKLAYIASVVKNFNESKYDSYLVVDGKEGKKYSFIYNLSFPSGDVPLYTAYKGEDECFIIRGNESEEYEYKSVMELKTLQSGKTGFIGLIYGDYSKKIKDKYFIHIGDEKFGPYDGLMSADYTTGSYIASDNTGNYAFITQKIKNWDNYIYKYRVITNNGKNDEHEYAENLFLYKGKPLYTVYDNYNNETGVSDYKVIFDNKPVGVSYDGINDFKFDSNTGIATFYTVKNNGFYLVEMKF